ncbi:MAG: DUF2075 domain-containing protein [Bacteroidales bacterium]|nr:DUF2075 domain-containing protein [Bacteroidales bacterium]
MIVYQSTKNGFLQDVLSNEIDTKIHDAFYMHLGRHTSFSEVSSWKNSMMYMNNVLLDSEISDFAGISIEFQVPLTSKRIDFIITGLNEKKEGQIIIIELKQWSNATLTDKDAIVKTWLNSIETETAHPSYQAWSYAALIESFNQAVQDKSITLNACAYLHNYTPDNVITNPFYSEHIKRAPVFLKPDAIKLRNFIKQFVKYGDDRDILYKIENGKLIPSKQLADSLGSMISGNQEFIMIDDQKLVYETAISMARKAKPEKKQVLIVEGGPGTGKSVVAINLLVELTKDKLITKYVSKNAAPREVYKAKLTGTVKRNNIDNMFGGTGCFYDCESNVFDVLIVDEAHRLNTKSGLYHNLGENQILEILKASKCSIFFIDNNQRIHVNDIGESSQIEKWAKKEGAIVKHLKLESQFRCNGSDGYLAWLDQSLQIRETANFLLSQEDFDFRIFTDPNEMRQAIIEKNKINNKSRIVAGYCWDWNTKKGKTPYDIEISGFNFRMKWNLTQDGSTWIIAENSINEAGCIHTCQGLELDYVGVIVGLDMKCENGKVITDVYKRSSNDQSIKGIKKRIKDNPEEGLRISDHIIKNTYRTLMTRGMKGCYVYFCNIELEKYFREKVIVSDEAKMQLNSESIVETDARIEFDVNEDVKYLDYLPLYSLQAACGAFGAWQVVEEAGWIKTEGFGRLNRSMFIVKAVGKSMEPLIQDGSLCVFRANVVGSRNNKIVLVQHTEYFDAENEGSYSIKKYTSEKAYDKETGEWVHERIILRPINGNYEVIVLDENEPFMIIGEFLGVL